MRLGFEIWAGIPMFWAVAPVRALTEGDVEWFGVGFELGGVERRIRGFG